MLKKHWHDMVLHGGRRADIEVWHTSITGKWQKQALARPCLHGRAFTRKAKACFFYHLFHVCQIMLSATTQIVEKSEI